MKEYEVVRSFSTRDMADEWVHAFGLQEIATIQHTSSLKSTGISGSYRGKYHVVLKKVTYERWGNYEGPSATQAGVIARQKTNPDTGDSEKTVYPREDTDEDEHGNRKTELQKRGEKAQEYLDSKDTALN